MKERGRKRRKARRKEKKEGKVGKKTKKINMEGTVKGKRKGGRFERRNNLTIDGGKERKNGMEKQRKVVQEE